MLDLHADHQRTFAENRFVYPVISRRARGLSIGVNLNPDKVCNFDCIYCQVERAVASETPFVETAQLLAELEGMLEFAISGKIWETEKFRTTPPELRRLNDMAFSGDGEPTTYRNFDDVVAACAAIKRRHGLAKTKMTLITNASMFHRPHVARGLSILDANQGEIWAKLDAGTEAYFRLIDRTSIPFRQILDNITAAARVRPLVIQSLLMRVANEPPSTAECEAFCERLNEIVASGGRLDRVQIYTIARRPAESYVTPLHDTEVDAIAQLVRERTQLVAESFYGVPD